MSEPHVEVLGAGVAGLCCAHAFAERDCRVTLRSAGDGPGTDCCSWWAGGMLAPWCERESAAALIATLGVESRAFWQRHAPRVETGGTLVLAGARDRADLEQFAARTESYRRLDAGGIAALEPALESRFGAGLHFDRESHLDPRGALGALWQRLRVHPSVRVVHDTLAQGRRTTVPDTFDWRIDCRGLAARDALPDLRGVRGEMCLLRLPELTLHRPIRLLHPRHPIYVVPRADGVYMVGATMIESDDRGPVSARSLMELLNSAHALHPAFGEARLLESGADARPAFADNLPRLRRRGRTLYVNGLFRHGFLCAPAMARRALERALDGRTDEEVMDEDHD